MVARVRRPIGPYLKAVSSSKSYLRLRAK
jgi:hypothetical protein